MLPTPLKFGLIRHGAGIRNKSAPALSVNFQHPEQGRYACL